MLTGVDRGSTRSVALDQQQWLEHGRRYANADYHMPNDAAEETRLAIVHQAFLLLLDGQLTVTRAAKTRILDVGAGTGDWAIAMAERYPDATVVATDVHSAFRPARVPANLAFQIDDARQAWTFGRPFDFVHMRCLAGAFAAWADVYAEVHRHLEPDGIFEISEVGPMRLADDDDGAGAHLAAYNAALAAAAARAGRPLGLAHLRKDLFEQAGLRVVRSTRMEIPIGAWAADPLRRAVGKMALVAALEGLEARSLRLLTRELAWTPDAVRTLCGRVQAELMRPGARATLQCQFVVARKLAPTHGGVAG